MHPICTWYSQQMEPKKDPTKRFYSTCMLFGLHINLQGKWASYVETSLVTTKADVLCMETIAASQTTKL